MKENTKTIGRQGEDLAAQALIQDGYQIVCRNYRQKYGEIDIIAKKMARCILWKSRPSGIRHFAVQRRVLALSNGGR